MAPPVVSEPAKVQEVVFVVGFLAAVVFFAAGFFFLAAAFFFAGAFLAGVVIVVVEPELVCAEAALLSTGCTANRQRTRAVGRRILSRIRGYSSGKVTEEINILGACLSSRVWIDVRDRI
jgi:hypothetical protein